MPGGSLGLAPLSRNVAGTEVREPGFPSMGVDGSRATLGERNVAPSRIDTAHLGDTDTSPWGAWEVPAGSPARGFGGRITSAASGERQSSLGRRSSCTGPTLSNEPSAPHVAGLNR